MLLVEILKLSSNIEKEVQKRLQKYGLTAAQFELLKILRNKHDELVTMGEIKDLSSGFNSDISRLIDRLVSKKFVERQRPENNRRKIYVKLTKEGRRVELELEKYMKELDCSYFKSSLSMQETEKLSDIITKLNKG